MEAQITLAIPHDFELLCLVLTCQPEAVLQDYVNRISLPKLLSGHPADPLGRDMQLVLTRTESQDPKGVDKKLLKFLKKDYSKELSSILKLELEQPELEEKICEFVNVWRPKIIEQRIELRNKLGLNFSIVGYDN
ncbi:hypothetical protein SAMN05421827_102253 [Pedobacter terrae]|uniref:Uncharacterized protein n=1 Tax=Pedobacter terrae TaxID=405671 RepID=A0A1G7QBY6_9SPHI|nr:hypothetical protein [Pedobacter terrae]SDF96023.1 hypothetical protein SAMN05421827_102253 [Pedobacter terrae]